MALIQSMSKGLTDIAKRNTGGMTEEKYEIVSYGLYILLSDLVKMTILFATAYLLGILFYSITAFISFSALRYFAGGVHAKTWWKCLGVNGIVIVGVVYLSNVLSGTNKMVWIGLLFPICILILYLYAPSDHENKPIVSKKQRKRLKNTSLALLVLMDGIAYFLPWQPVANIIIFSTFVECLTILPFTYKVAGNGYGDRFMQNKENP